ncbi:MAG: hypothetical protein BWY57_03397 [Betaproteobacteria bacterium ADurb.Bin341]|nr:MAG: hypothetical protein BWY57_03397 [Betaproteobacteria bacterium ADurb.Bin341]
MWAAEYDGASVKYNANTPAAAPLLKLPPR